MNRERVKKWKSWSGVALALLVWRWIVAVGRKNDLYASPRANKVGTLIAVGNVMGSALEAPNSFTSGPQNMPKLDNTEPLSFQMSGQI